MERNTHQKKVVIDIVYQLKGEHPSADVVYETAKNLMPSVSRATIYRILNRLSESGKLKRIKIPGAADVYDVSLNSHYHLRCNSCGKVIDLDIPIIENLPYNVNPSATYSITGYDIIFSGSCTECNSKLV